RLRMTGDCSPAISLHHSACSLQHRWGESPCCRGGERRPTQHVATQLADLPALRRRVALSLCTRRTELYRLGSAWRLAPRSSPARSRLHQGRFRPRRPVWRGSGWGEPHYASLAQANLTGANLIGANLLYVNLQGAITTGTSLEDTPGPTSQTSKLDVDLDVTL